MSSSIIHLCVAKEILRELNLEKEKFLFGNILPDFSNIENNHNDRRKITHFERKSIVNDIEFNVPNLEKLRNVLNLKSKDGIELGIYSHLYTDVLWINMLVEKHKQKVGNKVYIKTKNGLVEDQRKMIYEDYDTMNQEIIKNYDINIDFIKQCKYEGSLKEMYNMQINDIYKVMKEHFEKVQNSELKIFTMEEIYEFIRTAKDKIIKELKEIIGEENV
ncbi:MAG: hypothetical protein HFJ58_07445 [Clostridia bacterium]|nr:hypothetical protein [Clostridia bacterium]